MLRRIVAAFVVLFLVVGIIIAAEVKGTISKVEEAKKGKGTVVTVKVDDKDQTFRIGKMTKITGADGKEIDAKDAQTSLKEGDEVTITTEEVEKNGKKINVTKEIKVTKAKK